MSAEPGPTTIHTCTYLVTCVPDTVPQHYHWALRVLDRGRRANNRPAGP